MESGAEWARLYYNVSLIDCESKEILDELIATSGLQSFVVTRLSDRCVVVDGSKKVQIQRALARRAYPCRIVDLAPRVPTRVGEGDAR